MFDENLHKCVTSFLRLARRSYDARLELPHDAKYEEECLLRLFFLVCIRMATHKESKDHHISPHMFGEIIYENFIFDIPMLMDFCALYGSSNETIVKKMVSNIFTQQPKYNNDLSSVVQTMPKIFEAICHKCNLKFEGFMSPPRKLNESRRFTLSDMPLEQFRDILFYISDIAHTLWSFLDIYPSGSMVFSKYNFPVYLAGFYESLVTGFDSAFQDRSWPGDDDDDQISSQTFLRKIFYKSRVCLLKVFRQVLNHSCLVPLLENSGVELSSEYTEQYVGIMSSALNEKRFLCDYQHMFPIADDRDMLNQAKCDVDATRLSYIQDAIYEAEALHRPFESKSKTSVSKTGTAAPSTNSPPPGRSEIAKCDSLEDLGACAPKVRGPELESMISSVHDLLPDLGEGFIKICLEEYDYDVEKVVNAVLEDKLLPSLVDVDRCLPRVVEEAVDDTENSILAQRRNIYDGDEFDVFSRKIDSTKVHQGKKEVSVVKDLNDKSTIASLKPLYNVYGHEFTESAYDKNVEYEDDYEDEYDDTYDSQVLGDFDADSADELLARRPFVVPKTLQDVENQERDGGDSSNDEDGSNSYKPRGDAFVEDPAKLRQLAEQRRAAKQAMQRKGRGGGGGGGFRDNNAEPEVKVYDVKGVPKGRGQSAEVLKNRAYKERNKSSRVHHNRKDLSDRKRQF